MDWVMILFLLVCIGAWCEAMQRIDEKRKEDKEEELAWERQWDTKDHVVATVNQDSSTNDQDSSTNDQDSSPMTQEDWNVICRTAIEEAKAGNSKARDWVVKNIPTEAEQSCPFISDAIDALVQLGHKEAGARKIILALTSENTYDNLDDLIRDAFSNK